MENQQQLLETADRYIAGGSLGLFALPRDVDLVIDHGYGGHIVDVTGRDYVDFHLGSGPMLVGHAHPQIVSAVDRQLRKGSTYYFLNEPAISLAVRMVEAIPCADQMQFAGSGSEATLYALRLARAATGRQKVMKFEGAWHGMNDYALWGTVPTSASPYPASAPDSAGIPAVLRDNVLVAPFNNPDQAAAMIDRHAADLAAVIVEPLQRVLLPIPGFLEILRAATHAHGIILIFDEIVSGFRIAWGGAQERYGVVPDVATYGKAMSGGFPMAAIAGKGEIMQFLDPRRTAAAGRVWAGGTLNGNPISAAAGVASLEILSQPGVYDHLHKLGGRLRQGIREIGADHGFATQTPGEDAVFGVRFMENETPHTWTDMLSANKSLGLEWGVELIRRGILVNPNEKFYVSVAHTDADIDRALDTCEQAFAALRRRAGHSTVGADRAAPSTVD
jgi:glutamate-1-semialdehyde 2,1-aminomutase